MGNWGGGDVLYGQTSVRVSSGCTLPVLLFQTYLMNAVHTHLFRVLTAMVASEDAEINKMTRNLSSLQLQDLGIRKIFR